MTNYATEPPVILIHIPKTGGLAVTNSLPLDRAVGERHSHAGLARRREPLAGLWDRALKVAFVRNPFERFYSMHKGGFINRYKDEGFAAWLARQIRGDRLSRHQHAPEEPDTPVLWKPQLRWLIDYRTGDWLVDWVGRFERLEADFQTLCRQLGIRRTLIHQNSSAPVGDSARYREAYQPWMRAFVETHHAADLAAFDYAF